MTERPRGSGKASDDQLTPTEVTLTIPLGAGKTLEDLSEMLQHVTAVIDLGTQLHDLSSRNETLGELLEAQSDDAALAGFYFLGPDWLDRLYLVSPEAAQAVEDAYRGRRITVVVTRHVYGSPFSINIAFDKLPEAIVQVLRVIRDWKTDRRLRRAQAEDFESIVQSRRRLREALVDQIVRDGATTLTPAQADLLLTPTAVLALEAVGNADPTVTVDDEPLP